MCSLFVLTLQDHHPQKYRIVPRQFGHLQIIQGLKDQYPEHQNRIKRGTTALADPNASYLEINDSIHHLKGASQIASPLKSLVQVSQAMLSHTKQESYFTPKIRESPEVSIFTSELALQVNRPSPLLPG